MNTTINFEHYKNVLSVPRIDNKNIVYQFEFRNDCYGTVSILDLISNTSYTGSFIIKFDYENILVIEIVGIDCEFINEKENNCSSPQQVFDLEKFINKLTSIYIPETNLTS